MLVIDEPEIHFHPQMQRSLSTMMEKMSRNIGTQFIISTYSPLFINEENIAHVYRFSKPHLSTIVRTPEIDFSGDESSLVHLLKFENLSKIFFVNRIIMVEGETDAYFFDFYFKYLHSLPEWKNVLTDYEIVNINGKGGYRLWKKFLARFGISSYFIGDWDNVVDYGFLNQEQLTYYYKQAKHYRPNPKQVAGGSHYNKLVLTIKHLFPQQYEAILEHIDDLYRQQVFILKK
jgi:predicted ATP-dependent endonuclease of OLD family